MITHVAIKVGDKVYSLPKPNRHGHLIIILRKELIRGDVKHFPEHEQGFVNDKGIYLTREEALVEARACEQLLARHYPELKELYSESVW